MYANNDAMKKRHASTSARPTTPVTASGGKHNNKYSVKGTLLKQIHTLIFASSFPILTILVVSLFSQRWWKQAQSGVSHLMDECCMLVLSLYNVTSEIKGLNNDLETTCITAYCDQSYTPEKGQCHR